MSVGGKGEFGGSETKMGEERRRVRKLNKKIVMTGGLVRVRRSHRVTNL